MRARRRSFRASRIGFSLVPMSDARPGDLSVSPQRYPIQSIFLTSGVMGQRCSQSH
ncbi:hypothetical protein T03_13726 [Trichinella britovi]|uniref:Uncharacterized protein n=1 Tax=Trichinella britovi TaxID=45882 RepID=A0A0V0YY95_TRIBR|nr:hypothetical protein T03_13726 [Trichinella britovi]